MLFPFHPCLSFLRCTTRHSSIRENVYSMQFHFHVSLENSLPVPRGSRQASSWSGSSLDVRYLFKPVLGHPSCSSRVLLLYGAAYLYRVSALPCLLAAGTVPAGVAHILLLGFVLSFSRITLLKRLSPRLCLSFIFNLSATLLCQHTLFPGTHSPTPFVTC